LTNCTNCGAIWYGDGLKKLPAAFFRQASGKEPVREWVKELRAADRKIVGDDIRDLEFAWPVGLPLCRSLGGGLWGVRSNLTDGKIARVIFCAHGGYAVLLHAFVKKTQKTPPGDLELARKRMKEVTT
jgi:phage-related protein